MLFPALFATLLLLAPASQEPAVEPAPTFDEAVQLANEGRDSDALAAFQQIARVNPDDRAARLWIARLHERAGDFDRAEPVYRSILLEDPGNLDAMLGVVAALLARDEYKETLEILEVAEEIAPRDDRVLAALGKANRLAGQQVRAIAYMERAVAAAPTEQHRLLLESTRLSYQHRVETRGFSEQFNGSTPDSRSGTVAVNIRWRDTLRLIGRGEVQRKFGVRDERAGGGFEWRWKPAITVRAQAMVWPGNQVLPEGDYLGEVEYTRETATWTTGVRYFDFTGARTSVGSVAVAWPASERLALGLRYAFSWTETSRLSVGEIGNTAHVTAAYRLFPRISLQGGYAAGVDDFESFTIDRTGDFRANAVSAGVRIDLATLTTVVGAYEHQSRSGDVNLARVIFSLAQRF
jgi:tetratricopeptide (TPR) repeat protein